MALKEYKPETTFPGRMGRTIGESEPAWPAPLRAKDGPPMFCSWCSTTPASAASSAERHRRTSGSGLAIQHSTYRAKISVSTCDSCVLKIDPFDVTRQV